MVPKFRGICTIGMLMVAAALVLAPPEQAGAQDNVDYVELFKAIERIDGVFADPVNPYGFEACVGGWWVDCGRSFAMRWQPRTPLGRSGLCARLAR